MLLKQKTAIVSGAAVLRGLGLATPRLFASHGAWVAILDLDLNSAREASASLGSSWRRSGGNFGGPHYSAARAGGLGLAKSRAREFGPNGIRVNCVTPRPIETDITGETLAPEMKAETIKGIPLGRLGAASNLANVPRIRIGALGLCCRRRA